VKPVEPLRGAVARFLEAFETVFHEDWAYSRTMLGSGTYEASERARAELLRSFGESPQPPRHPEATFLDPRDPDAGEDWGNYGRLLDAYAKLRAAFDAGGG
jgi:hypothetical protein